MTGIFDDERRERLADLGAARRVGAKSPAKASKMLESGRAPPCAFLRFADDFASNAASRADPQQTLMNAEIAVDEAELGRAE